MPLVVGQLMEGYLEEELEVEREDYHPLQTAHNVEGRSPSPDADEMDVDEALCGWEGGTCADQEHLGSVLDDCLSIAA